MRSIRLMIFFVATDPKILVFDQLSVTSSESELDQLLVLQIARFMWCCYLTLVIEKALTRRIFLNLKPCDGLFKLLFAIPRKGHFYFFFHDDYIALFAGKFPHLFQVDQVGAVCSEEARIFLKN